MCRSSHGEVAFLQSLSTYPAAAAAAGMVVGGELAAAAAFAAVGLATDAATRRREGRPGIRRKETHSSSQSFLHTPFVVMRVWTSGVN